MNARDKKHKTNIEAMTEIMDFSRFGALAQVFVIDAVQKQADRVAAMTDEQVAEMDKTTPMLSMKAWRGVAQEVKAKLDEHLRGL